jgi:hypothetical protein
MVMSNKAKFTINPRPRDLERARDDPRAAQEAPRLREREREREKIREREREREREMR